MMKSRVTIAVEVEVAEVLEELDTEWLLQYLSKRQDHPVGMASLTQIYEEFARRGDAPQCLRDYLYTTIGRILP